ncbi:NAD(P)-dependent dehydrogenase (short-subunit alcohol dehydrogenase family) [Deinococcus metalli]|uniref:NAD(P)-dependent dehydrogenase (Short-subunit alcohol dehydrogenase family) n=1 Tax=Deinococcus metalli TaxID=1141878 RepID=A0A7W8KH13_9DEIO|nr:oxidoreductase [Deinococcus metalli]MBB5376988.1 NAD(P)-dependent dehydrogenase (short-subunit alcohol dehydrogenase family) [Deinococcus metalli]GHF46854.1 short-chain dehydrogenase [Deinococcus metalli]
MQIKRWTDLTPAQKTALVVAGAAQLGVFAAAWADLSGRRPENVNGQKAAWRAALFVNTLGPLAYFLRGRRHSTWTEASVPDQTGRVVIVTGANSGLGLETARVLAQHGATVVMACRNAQRAQSAAEQIRALRPRGEVVPMALDLGDLTSVASFAEAFTQRFGRLDVLVNNAGIMVPPLGRTAQGFETQFGVNHLGHFALTARLLPLLERTPGARVVTVSSIAHRFGHVDFTDPNWHSRPYAPMPAYGQSKLANLLFTAELQRRLTAAGQDVLAVAAHPGWASTGLQGDSSGATLLNRWFAQPAAQGALPTLYAATSPDAVGGGYYGPSGVLELGGTPQRVSEADAAQDRHAARRLWALSEELSGVEFTV